MASSCISSCVNDTRAPVRATYVNLYKWPESDAEFIRSVSSNSRKHGGGRGGGGGIGGQPQPRVVDSISCRQLYLRSYKFSREEDCREENTKCLGRIKSKKMENVRGKRCTRDSGGGGGGGRRGRRSRRKCGRLRRVKEVSCTALVSIFRRLLSCTTKVDVVN